MLPKARAAGDSNPIGYYTRTWTTDDGVPHNSVIRAVQDSKGFLWFGTSAGLARFDGRKFSQVDLGPASRSSTIRGLAEESPGVVLALTSGGDLIRLKNGVASEHPSKARLASLGQELFDLYVEPAGTIWLATQVGSIFRYTADGKLETFGVDQPVAARTKRFTFATDGNGTTWVASDDFLAAYRNDRLERHPQTPAGPLLIAPSKRGVIWICTSSALLKLERGILSLESDAVPWKGDMGSLRHLAELQQGDLVFTGRGSLIRYRDGRFLTFPTPFALANYILEDREASLWVGTTGGGVAQIKERAHRVFNETSGLSTDSVSALAEDGGSNIWVANRSGGLHRLDTASGRVGPWPGAREKTPVETVVVDRAGTVWFGSRDIGLWRLADPGAVPQKQVIPQNSGVNALLATRSGHVWFATTSGEVGRFIDDRIDPIAGQEYHELGTVYAMVEAADGTVWLGGRNGLLARWDGQGFTRYDPNSIPGAVHALLVDRLGVVWIGSSLGLGVYEAGKISWLNTSHGVPDDIIYNILEDDIDRLWLATRRGLFHVARQELVAAAGAKLKRITASRYGPEQGLRGFTPTPNFSPGAIKSSDGRLWFASTQGAVEIDVARTSRDSLPLPVLLDVIRWDAEAVSFDAKNRVEFPSGRHRIDFELVVLSYSDHENLALEHRLEGFDRDWVDTGRDHLATYTNLPPGEYRLLVRARTASAEWSYKGALISVTIVPAWWERTTTRVLTGVVLIALIGAVVRVIAQKRLRHRLRLLEQQHALEKERGRIARDLHDELGAGLTEVGMLADRLVPLASKQLAPQLSGLAWRARKLATELSGIVWTMNAGHASLDHFAAFVRRYAERLFRNVDTRCVTTGVELIPAHPLPPAIQHQLLATTKEALNNVLRHARATEVKITLGCTDGVFEVSIKDNGVGSSIRSVSEGEGNGLRNMSSRIEEIGGSFEFVSVPGEGTTVRFRLPLNTVIAED